MTQTDRLLALVLLVCGVLFLGRRNATRAMPGSRIARLGQHHWIGQHRLLSIHSDECEPSKSKSIDPKIVGGMKQPLVIQWATQRRAFLFFLVAIGVTFGVMWTVIAIVAWMVVNVIRKSRTQANQRKVLASGLVDLVDEMTRQLRGGRGVTPALLNAISHSSDQLQQALEPVVASLAIGTPPSRAIATLGTRYHSRDLHSLAMLLGAGEQLGGIHPDALDGLTTMMRERTTAGADVATQAAQARVSAIVLGCAPVVFCGLLVLSDGRSSAFLLHSPVGFGCSVVGLVLDACGAVWMSTVTRRAIA